MPRVYILVDKDEEQEAIVGRAKENGATVDWELAWFGEFNGWCSSFTDPWGVQILLWTTGANRPGPDDTASAVQDRELAAAPTGKNVTPQQGITLTHCVHDGGQPPGPAVSKAHAPT